MSAVSVSAGPGSRTGSRKERLQHIGMLWCLPYVIVFLGGTIIPMVYAFYLGLFKQQMIGGEQFTGFANYIRALQDPLLWDGFKRVAVFAVSYTHLTLPTILLV